MQSSKRSGDNDDELVTAYRQGDQEAYAQLIRRYQDVITHLICRQVDDPVVARDITQDVFVDAFLGLARLREPDKFGAWIKAIARHHCADWFQRAARERPLDEMFPSTRTPPDEIAERQELCTLVEHAMSRLTAENQRAIRLVYFDGLSCRQVAEMLGSSPGAVRNRLHESIKRMRKELSEMGILPERSQPIRIHHITQFGDPAQYGFGGRNTELYAAVYPSCDLSEKPWEGIIAQEEAQRALARWESMQIIRRTTRKIYGLVPICTSEDALRLQAWYDHFSDIVVDVVSRSVEELRDLIHGAVPSEDVNNVLGSVVICWALGARTGPLTGLTFSAGEGRIEREPGRRYACFGFAADVASFHKRDAGYVDRSHAGNSQWLGIHHGVNRDELISRINRWGNYYGAEGYRVFNTLLVVADESVSLAELRYAALGAGVQKEELGAYIKDLLAMHLITEREGCYRLAFPVLYHSRFEPATVLARDIAQEIVNQLPDSIEELASIAAGCSFADCTFNDVFQMAWCRALSCALDGLVESGVLPHWPESALGEWGMWLYCTDRKPCA